MPCSNHNLVVRRHVGPCIEEVSDSIIQNALLETHRGLQEYIRNEPEDPLGFANALNYTVVLAHAN